jgi:hypothetical protein
MVQTVVHLKRFEQDCVVQQSVALTTTDERWKRSEYLPRHWAVTCTKCTYFISIIPGRQGTSVSVFRNLYAWCRLVTLLFI